MDQRECLNCGQKVIGRSDKKYCSPQCRSEYYNHQNRETIQLITEINNILKKNRNLLAELNPNGKRVISERKMLEKGFNFTYFTDSYVTKTNRTYHYCYDQGYYVNPETREVLLVVKKDYIHE